MKLRVWHLGLVVALLWAYIIVLSGITIRHFKRNKFYQCCSANACLKQHMHEVK